MIESETSGRRKIIRCVPSQYTSIGEIGEAEILRKPMTESLSYADGTTVPDYLTTSVAAEWNDGGIFVFFRGAFRSLRYATNTAGELLHKKTHHLWEKSDVFEVFIGPDASRRKMYKEFQADPEGRWVDIDVWNALGTSNHFWHSGCAVRSMIDQPKKIWASVFYFPWRCFDADRLFAGEWNVNFYRASGKYHGDELLAWSPVGTGPRCFHRPEHFGVMEFITGTE